MDSESCSTDVATLTVRTTRHIAALTALSTAQSELQGGERDMREAQKTCQRFGAELQRLAAGRIGSLAMFDDAGLFLSERATPTQLLASYVP